MYSTDAINWTSASAAEANGWNSVTYGGGKFVAVATVGTNRVMWSLTGADPTTELTFADPCTDLQYFNVGDTVSANEGNALYAAQSPAFSTTLYTGDNSQGSLSVQTGIDNQQ